MDLFRDWNWEPPEGWLNIKTIDLHTGGEPLRVFTGGLPEIRGNTKNKVEGFSREWYCKESFLFECSIIHDYARSGCKCQWYWRCSL